MSEETRIDLENGKYSVIHSYGQGLRALRYGELWRDLAGDGLILAMAHEIERLKELVPPSKLHTQVERMSAAANSNKHTEKEYFVEEYLKQKGAETADDDANIMLVDLKTVIQLLKDYGAPDFVDNGRP